MANKREPVSKKVRFEVFKRDKFTCQYCGAKAPDVVLNADHINPVANGGDSGIMNLVTSCFECNNGKAAKLLDDRSSVELQRTQVEELQARREQLEMMLQWRDGEQAARADVLDEISARLGERGGFVPSESGRSKLRRWLKRFAVQELLVALDEAFDAYMEFNGDKPIQSAWETAFAKIPAIANLRRQAQERPHVVKVAYIQAILRRRFHDPRGNYFEALESYVVDDHVSEDALEEAAKAACDWSDFCARANAGARHSRGSDPFEEYLSQLEPEREPEPAIDDGFDDDGYDRDGCDD